MEAFIDRVPQSRSFGANPSLAHKLQWLLATQNIMPNWSHSMDRDPHASRTSLNGVRPNWQDLFRRGGSNRTSHLWTTTQYCKCRSSELEDRLNYFYNQGFISKKWTVILCSHFLEAYDSTTGVDFESTSKIWSVGFEKSDIPCAWWFDYWDLLKVSTWNTSGI